MALAPPASPSLALAPPCRSTGAGWGLVIAGGATLPPWPWGPLQSSVCISISHIRLNLNVFHGEICDDGRQSPRLLMEMNINLELGLGLVFS